MSIFIELMAIFVLILLAVWDLFTCRLPYGLLIGFLLLSFGRGVCSFLDHGWLLVLVQAVSAVVLGGSSVIGYKKGWMGGGDIWILAGLPFLMLPDLLWRALESGLLHAGITSVILLTMGTKVEKMPLVPFIAWGWLEAAGR